MRHLTATDGFGYGLYWGYISGRKRPVLAMTLDDKLKPIAVFNDELELIKFDRLAMALVNNHVKLEERNVDK